jgi:hypothetical protein
LKKGIAIVLLIVHVFNLAGYHALFAFLQQKASTQIIEQLDNGAYQAADLVEVKIPYPLPYSANWPDYQRFDGEVDMNGLHYNYVQRKMSNDTLYLLCIPNGEKAKLVTAKNDYFNSINEISNPSQQKKSSSNSIEKVFCTEYSNLIEAYSLPETANPFTRAYPSAQPVLLNQFISSPFQPPKA